MYYYSKYNSFLGEIILVSDGKNLTNLYFRNRKFSKENYFNIINERIKQNDNLEIFKLVKNWLFNYFNGKDIKINFPLLTSGTIFQENVWEILKSIPYGHTTTYGNISQKVAKILNKDKMSAQAVGGAVGCNPIPIIIPCHRVIGKDNKLVGYSGGLDIKIKLLKLEKVL